MTRIQHVITAITATVFLIAATGCSHIVTIDSDPPGAEISVNGQKIGNAPVQYTEKTGWDKAYQLEARKSGYKTAKTTIQQSDFNTSVIIGVVGASLCFFPWSLAGLLVARQLPDSVVVSLERGSSRSGAPPPANKDTKTEDGYDYGY